MVLFNSEFFHFEYLISLLGEKTSDYRADQFLNFIHNNLSSEFTILEPLQENIINQNDKWKTYESQKRGLIIEIVNETIACLSFLSGLPVFNSHQEISQCYPYLLLDNLSLSSNRMKFKNIYGTPIKHNEFIDQFKIDEKITMGVLYNEPNGKAAIVSYGISNIFSNPHKSPNRFSLIFWSLS
jgi:hypothetical protein